MSKYRFKTKEEFIRDGLWNEKNNCPHNWCHDGDMNEYLGIDVPDECIVYCDKNEEFKYDGWHFKSNEYVLKEQQEYFDDLSQHIGRYIRALVDNPHAGSGVKKGDVGKIINEDQADFPNNKEYFCTEAFREENLGVKYELLPEDYSPEQEVKEPSIEFIPGKWYNFTTMKGKYNLYVKVDFFTNEELYFTDGRYICNKSYDHASSIDIEEIENPRLVEDLSEIQEYLPEGHPDKIVNRKFEIGKWYKWYQKNHENYHYGKVKEINVKTDTLVMSPWIIGCTDYNYSGTFYLSKAEQIQEISVEEVQEFLPKNHSDKISSDEFKKGEYIVLIGKGQSISSATLLEDFRTFIQNHCYKVRESCRHLRVELDSIGSKTNGWQCILYNPNKFHKTRNWRYATQEEIDEYERRGKPYNVTELQKKELSMEEIQEECKKRFPIGCTYISTSKQTKILKDDSYNYCIVGKNIWAHSGGGCLYENGKWAELVSLPEENITEIPEYVECFKPYGKAIKEKIYKTTDENEASKLFGLSWKKVLIDFKRLEYGSFKISNKEAYEQQKPLTYESASGCFPTDKNIFIYDEVSQYLSTAFDYWKNVPTFVEKEFDIYGPTPDIE